jgi:hypothetical protein
MVLSLSRPSYLTFDSSLVGWRPSPISSALVYWWVLHICRCCQRRCRFAGGGLVPFISLKAVPFHPTDLKEFGMVLSTLGYTPTDRFLLVAVTRPVATLLHVNQPATSSSSDYPLTFSVWFRPSN